MEMFKLKEKFINKEIDRVTFMKDMYDISHIKLSEYMQYMNVYNNIKNINIDKDRVVMTFDYMQEEIKLICNFEDKLSMPFRLFNVGYYETDEMDMILNIVEDNWTVFDIGSNIGLHTILLNKKFKNLNMYSFEPIPNTFDILKINLGLNNITSKIFNCGISDDNTNIQFYFNKGQTAASSMRDLKEDKENTDIITCKVMTLDSFCEEQKIEKIDFIKIDVEGSELLAFKGGMKVLEKYKPIIFSEMLRKWAKKFGYHPNDIINLLSQIGYTCFSISGNKLNKIEKVTEDTIETNYIFLDLNILRHKNIAEQSRAEQIIKYCYYRKVA